jgi:hypothetical protein
MRPQRVVCRGGRWADSAAGSRRHCGRAGVLALKGPALGQLLGWVLVVRATLARSEAKSRGRRRAASRCEEFAYHALIRLAQICPSGENRLDLSSEWAAAAPARDGTLHSGWQLGSSRESSYRRYGCRRSQTARPGRSCPRVTSARPSGGLSARGARGGSRPSGARPATRLPVWTGTGLVGATGTDRQGQRHKENQRDGVVHGVHGLSFRRPGPAPPAGTADRGRGAAPPGMSWRSAQAGRVDRQHPQHLILPGAANRAAGTGGG